MKPNTVSPIDPADKVIEALRETIGNLLSVVAEANRKEEWIAERINQILPADTCARCLADSPEDGSSHFDHFFDGIKLKEGV